MTMNQTITLVVQTTDGQKYETTANLSELVSLAMGGAVLLSIKTQSVRDEPLCHEPQPLVNRIPFCLINRTKELLPSVYFDNRK